VKSLLRVAADDDPSTLRGAFFTYAHARAGKEKRRSQKPQSEALYGGARNARYGFRDWPRGTGKTYLAVAMAVSALLSKQVNRIILARPPSKRAKSSDFCPAPFRKKSIHTCGRL